MKGTIRLTRFFLLGIAVLFILSGCYKTPPELSEAQKAIQKAQEAEAPKYAPAEFSSAEDLLRKAEKSDVDKEKDDCRNYSIQARDQAELAYKKALEEAERARRLAAEEAERLKNAKQEVKPPEDDSARRAAEMKKQQRRMMVAQMKNNKVYFDYNRAEIRKDQEDKLKKNADILREYSDMPVTIEGHCDERGSDAYNIALGERRAQSSKKYLMKLGVEAGRMDTVSYGESRPEDAAHDESAWQKNRRAIFDAPAE